LNVSAHPALTAYAARKRQALQYGAKSPGTPNEPQTGTAKSLKCQAAACSALKFWQAGVWKQKLRIPSHILA
jgi:hypothetical protein